MYHKFNSSLAKGQEGEELLLTLMPNLTRLDGRKHDFVDLNTGETYELKTDSYSMDKTANFFMEAFSDLDRGKFGGPWQAKLNGSSYFVYMYPKSQTMFIFDTRKLVEALEHIVCDLHPVKIPNKTWITTGFKVPREALKSIYTVRSW